MTTTDLDFGAPPFYCPIPPAIHPAVDEVRRQAIEWIDQTGLCRTERDRMRAIATNSAEFYGRFSPSAPVDGLLVAVLWVYWGFLFDDACCDSGPLSADPAKFVAIAASCTGR
ncbi:hypothetical protein ALI144C_37005 [Actinosynnema sp. ALI-1.44]|uniref:hypothetical protein n=1 Tax=Actinosynnema sp. ALI-1.44 TaxID=1933779 RepID=UPI00097BFDEE|nr:hypothetical protein [Actinosynnema sp. ALI-1.44]ONI76262.1 hypothetical protein ALI144C_37005 [Actinosynnema sp. ALI-1.44]